jgi:hypothetical protein
MDVKLNNCNGMLKYRITVLVFVIFVIIQCKRKKKKRYFIVDPISTNGQFA